MESSAVKSCIDSIQYLLDYTDGDYLLLRPLYVVCTAFQCYLHYIDPARSERSPEEAFQ